MFLFTPALLVTFFTCISSIKNPFSWMDDFDVEAYYFSPIQSSNSGNNGPQVFTRQGKPLKDWALGAVHRDLRMQGYHCSANDTTFVCNPSIGFDTIDASCYFDYYQGAGCVAIAYNRQFNRISKFKFRSQRNCQKPQVWKRMGAKAQSDLQGDQMVEVLNELNAKGYECTGDSNTFTCANPIPQDTVKGSCLGTISDEDPVKCQVDKIYNHFTLKKILPCCFPGDDSCKE